MCEWEWDVIEMCWTCSCGKGVVTLRAQSQFKYLAIYTVAETWAQQRRVLAYRDLSVAKTRAVMWVKTVDSGNDNW